MFARPGGARARARRRATGSCQDLGLQVWPFWPLELPLAFGRVCFPPVSLGGRPGRRLPVSLAFGGCAFPPVSLGRAGDCPCSD